MVKLICSILFISCLLFGARKQLDIPVKGYSLFWSDEFNGNELNTKKWNYRGLGKRDEAYITKDMVSVDGKGHLVMKVAQRKDSILASMISTDGIMMFKYGYFECRARFANAKGTISAFWLQSPQINATVGTPETNGAEIDMFEYFPNLGVDQVLHTMHWGGYGATHHVEGPIFGKLTATADNFHTIGFEWTDTSYATFVDGIKTFSGNQLISKTPEYLILSLLATEVGAGKLDTTKLPAEYLIDYVRVYKKE